MGIHMAHMGYTQRPVGRGIVRRSGAKADPQRDPGLRFAPAAQAGGIRGAKAP